MFPKFLYVTVDSGRGFCGCLLVYSSVPASVGLCPLMVKRYIKPVSAQEQVLKGKLDGTLG